MNVSSDDLDLDYGQATWASYVEEALADDITRHVAIAGITGANATPTAETLFGRGPYTSAAQRYWVQVQLTLTLLALRFVGHARRPS